MSVVYLAKDGITIETVHVMDIRRLKKAGYRQVAGLDKPESTPEPRENAELGDHTVSQLKKLAKDRGLDGYASLNKQGLIDLLKGGD